MLVPYSLYLIFVVMFIPVVYYFKDVVRKSYIV